MAKGLSRSSATKSLKVDPRPQVSGADLRLSLRVFSSSPLTFAKFELGLPPRS